MSIYTWLQNIYDRQYERTYNEILEGVSDNILGNDYQELSTEERYKKAIEQMVNDEVDKYFNEHQAEIEKMINDELNKERYEPIRF